MRERRIWRTLGVIAAGVVASIGAIACGSSTGLGPAAAGGDPCLLETSAVEELFSMESVEVTTEEYKSGDFKCTYKGTMKGRTGARNLGGLNNAWLSIVFLTDANGRERYDTNIKKDGAFVIDESDLEPPVTKYVRNAHSATFEIDGAYVAVIYGSSTHARNEVRRVEDAVDAVLRELGVNVEGWEWESL
jgi:hypothetical protein